MQSKIVGKKNDFEVNILVSDTQGLINDAEILRDFLCELGVSVEIHRRVYGALNLKNRVPLFIKKIKNIFSRSPFSIIIHLEEVYPKWFSLGEINIWIPNPEFVNDVSLESARSIDYLLCKTKCTADIFNNYFEGGDKVRYIGFSSKDNKHPEIPKHNNKFLHVMGKSPLKGTRTLVEAWSCNPQWPTLLIVANKNNWHDVTWLDDYKSANIDIKYGPIKNKELVELQNSRGVHLCPSETEGFGHYIMEALSTGAIVLTTNAPPMNELVDHCCGFLADPGSSKSMSLATRHFVDVSGIEIEVNKILALEKDEFHSFHANSRKRFEDNATAFRVRMNEFLLEIRNKYGF